MGEMVKETVRIRPDQKVRLDFLGIQISNWVRDKIDTELMGEEVLKKELRNIKEKEKEIRIQLKNYKDALVFESEKERDFLRDTKKAINQKPKCLNARLNRYRDEFNKPYFSKEVFIKKLERA